MRKCSIIKIVLSSILIMLTFPTKTDITATAVFDVTDIKTNINYHITQNNDTLHITSDNFTLELYIAENILNILCYDSEFAFLCASETTPNNYHYKIREYNINSGYHNSIETNITVSENYNEFYTDNNGVYYLSCNTDNKSIHLVSDSSVSTIKSPAAIYQILSINNDTFLVFTTKGTYSFINKTLSFLSPLLPATPCVYSGNSIITDSKNRKYQFTDNHFSELIEQSEYITLSTSIKDPAESPITIKGNSIIIPQNTTFAKLYKYLHIEKYNLKVTKQNSDIITSGKLGTGMIAEYDGKSFHIIVSGDLTGEGNINSRDLKSLMKHLTDEALLDEPYLSAADLYCDNEINTKDLLRLSKLY